MSVAVWYVHLAVSKLNPSPNPTSTITNNSQTQQSEDSTTQPTPFPEFSELTIPFLREKTYTSSLNELRDYSQTATYTSYLTSYDSDGLRVNALITKPKGEMPEGGWPGIVFVHGYIPPNQYKTTQNYESYVDYFAKNGFVVFKIDLRGHGESEGIPGGAYYSGDYVIDTLNARAALQKSDFVNPDRIGLWGHSMAGNVVFRSVIAAQNIPAAVIWAGAVYTYEDLQTLRLNDNSYRPPSITSQRSETRQRLYRMHGEFDPESSYWQSVVPVNFVEGITTPLQIHHAVDDSVVNIEYSRGLKNILDNSTIPLEVFEYASGGHNITGSSFNSAMIRSVEFFKENL